MIALRDASNPFRAALKLLDDGRSWGQGKGITHIYEQFTGRIQVLYCANSALRMAGDVGYQLLADIIEEQYPGEIERTWGNERFKLKNPAARIVIFNDRIASSYEEVERMFEKAAERWDSEH